MNSTAVSDDLILELFNAHRARQLYTNISMLFLFPVKDVYGKLSTGVNAQRYLSCYGLSSIIKHYLTKHLYNTSITQPTLSFYL